MHIKIRIKGSTGSQLNVLILLASDGDLHPESNEGSERIRDRLQPGKVMCGITCLLVSRVKTYSKAREQLTVLGFTDNITFLTTTLSRYRMKATIHQQSMSIPIKFYL